MYTPKKHLRHFTHSLRLDALPKRFQELIHDWARYLPAHERLEYTDGEFYMVVPFDILMEDTISIADLSVFTRRFNRLQEVAHAEGLEQHIAAYPCQQWHRHGQEFDNYMEMMFLLNHLKEAIPFELIKPSTLAIFVHD